MTKEQYFDRIKSTTADELKDLRHRVKKVMLRLTECLGVSPNDSLVRRLWRALCCLGFSEAELAILKFSDCDIPGDEIDIKDIKEGGSSR